MAAALVCRVMPSARTTSPMAAPFSGSSAGSTCSATSTRVTSVPKRWNAWASSSPIGPAPSTTSERGSSPASIASRLVQKPTSSRPSIGGLAGSPPLATTTPRRAWKRSPSTSTARGPAIRASPRRKVPPLRRKRSTAISSSQLAVASLTRAATGAHEGSTVAVPASRSTRRASATALAARTIIFEGMQPQ